MKRDARKSLLVTSVLLWVILCLGLGTAAAEGSKPIRLVVDGRLIDTAEPPVLINETVYVPIRAVAEAMDAHAYYYESTNTVEVRKRDFFHVFYELGAIKPPGLTLDKTIGPCVDPRLWERALREMTYPTDWVKYYLVTVLPYGIQKIDNRPSGDTMAASTQAHQVYVFSQAAEWTDADIIGCAIHEFGHEVWFTLMNEESKEEYRVIRSINDERRFNSSAAHSNRPEEIFAEDFRLLFTGWWPADKPPHENKDLPAPENVPGLREFMLGLTEPLPDSP